VQARNKSPLPRTKPAVAKSIDPQKKFGIVRFSNYIGARDMDSGSANNFHRTIIRQKLIAYAPQ